MKIDWAKKAWCCIGPGNNSWMPDDGRFLAKCSPIRGCLRDST